MKKDLFSAFGFINLICSDFIFFHLKLDSQLDRIKIMVTSFANLEL